MMSTRPSATSAAAPVSHFAKIATIAAATWAGALAQPVLARPSGQVVQGNVTFEHVGNTTIIRASDGSIINYLNFNIGMNEIVQFIQPGELARVLNRVTGPDPSVIAGTLLANGQVYIVNPAGVYFHNGAVVDVAGLYAAAGSLSNAKFLAGVNQFSNLSGSVVNNGLIQGRSINLLGQNVVNNGAIKAPNGVVVMAAGDSVYLTQQGGKITVKIDGVQLTDKALPQGGTSAPSMIATPGVENTGLVQANAGSIVLGAGDMYSLAIRNSGTIGAGSGNVTLAAKDGLIHNTATGSINANVHNGTAGDITVQGPSVVNAGRISASANIGTAGSIEVTSQNHTFLTDGSVISATGGTGNAKGGEVLVHSYDGLTVMSRGARVDVSGGATGGDGGFAEVSGKMLTFNGFADLGARPGYKKGSLLLDPINITINEFGGDDAFLNDGIIDFNEGGNSVFISAAALEAMFGSITLQATGNISVFHALNFDPSHNNDLTLEAYENIFINASITGARNLVLTANYQNLGSGLGIIQVDAPINIFGDAILSGRSISLNGASLTTGGVQRYLSPVDLCVDTTLNGTDIRFFDTLNAVDPGQQGLTVNIVSATDGALLGKLYFDSTVGLQRALENLTVNGATEINGGMVFTKDFQRYFGATSLGADTVLASSNSGDIHFGDTLDGTRELFIATGGLTQFDGLVGGNAKLKSVFTDSPGQTQIGADMKAGVLAYGDDVLVANDITLTGDTLVDFAKSIAGQNHDMIVKSPLTWFHGNATGFDLLQTDANGVTNIGQQPLIDGPLPVEIAGNMLDFNDHVVLLWHTNFTGIDFVDFDKTVNGGFDMTTNSDHLVRFGGNVGNTEALASLTTNVGAASLIDQNLVIFDGTSVKVDGDINFNPAGRNSPAEVATIAARNVNGITIQSLNGNILMGPNEKLTSLGNLNLQALNGHMVLGDLNSFGNMNITSPDIRIRTRVADSILNSNGGFDPDGGVDFVSGGSMFFSSKPTLLGGGAEPLFAVAAGKTANGNVSSDFEVRTYNGLTSGKFKFGQRVLDLTPPEAPQIGDFINQTTGPNRINDRVILDPIATQPLGDLAINVRPLNDDELLGTTTGRYLQNDMFTKPPKGTPDEHTVAANRLRRDAILNSLGSHSNVYFKQEVDEETGEVKTSDQTQAVRDALGKAWKAYLARETAEGEQAPSGFLAYLQNEPEQEEALTYFQGLHTLVRELKISGMTKIELRNSLNAVLPKVKPSEMNQSEFEQALGVETL